MFHLEEIWLSDARCAKKVEAASTSTWEILVDNDVKKINKIKKNQCSKDLEWWNKNCFGNVKRDLEERKKSLERAETEARRIGINTRVRELKAEINVLLDREIRMWSQRSRVLWLSKGDSNSKYFHS